MKVFGFFVVIAGLVIAWIGITGSQHRIAAIIKGVHIGNLNLPSNSKPAPKPTTGVSTQIHKTGGTTSTGSKT
jgi:hypothetical protein